MVNTSKPSRAAFNKVKRELKACKEKLPRKTRVKLFETERRRHKKTFLMSLAVGAAQMAKQAAKLRNSSFSLSKHNERATRNDEKEFADLRNQLEKRAETDPDTRELLDALFKDAPKVPKFARRRNRRRGAT